MNLDLSKEANLPTKFGNFKIQAIKENSKEHLLISKKVLINPPLLRIHSECLTGDALGSLKCDCGEQLNNSLELISKEGGILIYLRQEGRGIGLFNKVNAYNLQDDGLDTVEANHSLGFEEDLRTYEVVLYILNKLNIKSIRLLTNNPNKVNSLKGIEIVERIPILTNSNVYNKKYLKVKREKMDHIL